MSSSKSSGLDSLIELLSSEEGVRLQSQRLEGLKRLAEFELQTISLDTSPDKLRGEIKQRKKAGLASDAPFSFDRNILPLVINLASNRNHLREYDSNDTTLPPTSSSHVSFSTTNRAQGKHHDTHTLPAASKESDDEEVKSTLAETTAQDLIRKLEEEIRGLGVNLSEPSFTDSSKKKTHNNISTGIDDDITNGGSPPHSVLNGANGDPWAAIRKNKPNRQHLSNNQQQQQQHQSFPHAGSASFSGTSNGNGLNIPSQQQQDNYPGPYTNMQGSYGGVAYPPYSNDPSHGGHILAPQSSSWNSNSSAGFVPPPQYNPNPNPSIYPYAYPYQQQQQQHPGGVGYNQQPTPPPYYYQQQQQQPSMLGHLNNSTSTPYMMYHQQQQQPPYSQHPSAATAAASFQTPLQAALSSADSSMVVDPQQQAMLAQMQRVAEQMERDNEKLMRQLEIASSSSSSSSFIGGGGGGSGGGGLGTSILGGRSSLGLGGGLGSGIMGGGAGDHMGLNGSESLSSMSSTQDERSIQTPVGSVGAAAVTTTTVAPTTRLGKLEQKHQEDLRIMQHEIEKLKQQQELEEFKANLEKSRHAKAQDDAHEIWLAEQKQQLQALKIKQAIAKEQKLLSIQLEQQQQQQQQETDDGYPPPSNDSIDTDLPDPTVKHTQQQAGSAGDAAVRIESGVGTANLPLNLLKGAIVVADGILLSRNSKIFKMFKMGDSFRLALGVYDSSGKILSKLAASDWQPWNTTTSTSSTATVVKSGTMAGNNDDHSRWFVVEYLRDAIMRSVKQQQGGTSGGNSGNGATGNISSARGCELEGARCLVEVQIRSDSNGGAGGLQQKSAGWGILTLDYRPKQQLQQQYNINSNDNSRSKETSSGGSSSVGKMLNNGLWRVAIRTGTPNPTIDPRSSPTDDTRDDDEEIGWVLLRVADISDATTVASWSAGKSLGSTAARALAVYTDSLAPPLPPRPLAVADRRRSSVASTTTKLPALKIAGGGGSHDPLGSARNTARSILTGRTSARTGTVVNTARSVGDLAQPGKPSTILDTLVEDDLDGENDLVSGGGMSNSLWLLGAPLGPCTDMYQRGDGIDIYIDAARFLPDNCTVSRVVLKLFTSDKEQVGGIFECHAAGDCSATSPTYKYKVECRAKIFNPTTTALLRIDTMDSSTLLPSVVGYTAFKLFATRNRVQPKDSNENSVFINSGKFQLPIYAGRPPPVDLYNDKMLDGMVKIPCASVLVRIYDAPKSSDGLSTLSRDEFPREDWLKLRLDIPSPLYSSGAYFGGLCEPVQPYEPFAYSSKESSPTASQSIDVAITQAIAMHQSQGGSRMSTMLPPKPTGTLVALEQRQWLEKLLPTSTEMRNIVDYSFSLPYTIDAGVSVCIHQLFNMPDFTGGLFKSSESVLYKTILSIVPPGLYYKDPPLSEGVQFVKMNDFDRPAMAPCYNDGFYDFYPPEMHQSVFLIIDVRAVQIDMITSKEGGAEPLIVTDTRSSAAANNPSAAKAQTTSKSSNNSHKKAFWTMLPLARELVPGQGYKYVNMGVFQLPLIEGRVPPIGDLFNSPNPWKAMLSRLEYKNDSKSVSSIPGLSLSADGASVIVQVVNPLLKDICGIGKGLLTAGGSGAAGAPGRVVAAAVGSGAAAATAAARRSSVIVPGTDGVTVTDSGKMYIGLRTFLFERMIRAAAAGATGSRVATIDRFAFDPTKYTNNKAKNAKGGGTKSLAQTLPKGISLEEADLRMLQKKVNKSFAAATGIQYDS